MKTDKFIARRQLMALAFVGILSPLTRLLPNVPAEFAGHAAWLAPVLALPVCVIYFRILASLMAMRRDGQGMSDLIYSAWGRHLGAAAVLVFALWLVLYTGFTLRTASERLLSTVYNYGSTWQFSLLLAVIAVIAARGTLRSLARSAQIYAGIIGAILLLLFVFSAADIKMEYLLPVTLGDLPGLGMAAIAFIDLISFFGYYTFIYNGVRREDRDEGITMGWMLMMLGVMFAVMLTTLGNLSAPFCVRLQSPFFIMIRNISFFGVVERVEALVLGIWIITDFTLLAGEIMIASHMLSYMTEKIKRETWCLIIGILSFLESLFMSSSAFQLIGLSEIAVPLSNMFLTLIMLPAVWITLKIKARIAARRSEGRELG